MTRRTFLSIAATSAAIGRPRGLVLEAESGARLPDTLIVPMLEPAPLFERREYRSSSPRRLAQVHRGFTQGMFARAGIHPAWCRCGESLAYLIPFNSLAQRGEAWTRFDADPEWHRLRDRAESVSLSGVTIYRPRGAGKLS